MKKYIVIILAFILGAYAQAGAYNTEHDGYYVGFKKMTVQSKKTGEEFPVALVYPSSKKSKNVQFGPFNMRLSVGAKIADGQFPLVLISHGSGGTNLGYRSIAFELARQGYVVAMPLHPQNNYKNNRAQGTNKNWRNRPLHISATIDNLLANQTLATHINANKIAVVGHSAGGYTALALAGGVADTAYIITLCKANPEIGEDFCGLVKENKIKPEAFLNVQDKRVKAIVLLAPVGVLFKSKTSLSGVNVPTLMLSAEKDEELTEPYHTNVIKNNFPNKKLLLDCTVKNAGHYSFITPFPDAIKQDVGLAGQDPKGFDRKKFHEALSVDVVAFINKALSKQYDSKMTITSCLNK